MKSHKLEDPFDISSLLFQSNEDDANATTRSCYYVGPVTITNTAAVSGRGLIATRDIAAGECLFVTPATVFARVETVYPRWVSRNSQPGTLEEISEQVLIEEMKSLISNKDEQATVGSFMTLMGASASNTTSLSIAQLLGRGSDEATTSFTINDISDNELLQIIRRNAFGPDFVTYLSIEQRWLDHNTYIPRRLLGLFPFAAMINHSCVPNAVRVFAGDTMIAHACDSIKTGQEIVWSYLPPTQPYPQRHATLRHQHGFVCQCRRCTNEAEFWNTPPASLSILTRDSWVRLCNRTLDDVCVQEARSATIRILEDVLQAKDITNETKHFIRVGFAEIYISYLNYALQLTKSVEVDHLDHLLQRICMPLHLSMAACNNASTEHLSILHVCYDLIGTIHSATKERHLTVNKLRFWTAQVQKACMVRYGNLGNDIESVRKAMQHTRAVLRNKDGFAQSTHGFI
ncbi:hypothetical protein FisN_21Lh119 [Fistulifera solaris]|uniref:SET domain-containing protein n=1 Tax=Fistulifera solaris TaxID=1519565 RepID=A0A1Z5J9J2_FISSO|nr:hypothetical protein FisN_21Lh119 [Fistulifera solaris]|eukprot:GAX10421.1 hypothetical protein FisN_21Lh119 [Fistulifera solaris]